MDILTWPGADGRSLKKKNIKDATPNLCSNSDRGEQEATVLVQDFTETSAAPHGSARFGDLLWVAIPNHLGPQRTPSTLLLEVVRLKDVLKGAGFEAEPSSTWVMKITTTTTTTSHIPFCTILHNPSQKLHRPHHQNLPCTLFTRCFSKVCSVCTSSRSASPLGHPNLCISKAESK